MIYYEVIDKKTGFVLASEENPKAAAQIASKMDGVTVKRVRNEYGSFDRV